MYKWLKYVIANRLLKRLQAGNHARPHLIVCSVSGMIPVFGMQFSCGISVL